MKGARGGWDPHSSAFQERFHSHDTLEDTYKRSSSFQARLFIAGSTSRGSQTRCTEFFFSRVHVAFAFCFRLPNKCQARSQTTTNFLQRCATRPRHAILHSYETFEIKVSPFETARGGEHFRGKWSRAAQTRCLLIS